MRPQLRHFKDATPEPEKYETVLEYCNRFGIFGVDENRCPDCYGHPKQTTTEAWDHWNQHDSAKALYHNAWSENEREKEERRRLHPKSKPPPTPERQCQATAVTTGKQCGMFRDPDDPAGLCFMHRRMVERYGPDELHRRAEAFAALVVSIVE